MKNLETLLKDYADHVAERAAKGIPPLPLNAEQTNCITKLLEQDSTYDSSYLLDLLINRVPPGVDEAAYVKASWLTAIVNSEKYCKSINPNVPSLLSSKPTNPLFSFNANSTAINADFLIKSKSLSPGFAERAKYPLF